MKHKALFSLLIAAGILLNTYGLPLAYNSYWGHREYGYNAYKENPEDRYDAYSGKRQERRAGHTSGNDGVAVLGILTIVGLFWLYRRLRGESSSIASRSGGSSYGGYAGRSSSPSEESSSYASRPDPSIGHFWGNPEDGTTVKSLWGTTKDE